MKSFIRPMDAATSLARWKELTPEQWAAAANRVLPPLVTGALVIALAWQLAALTWALVPDGAAVRPAPEVAVAAGSGSEAGAERSFEALAGAQLFGEPPAAASEPAATERVVDAPDTTLNLQLTGIVARDESERGQAIIASGRDTEKIYSVGDTIEGANGTRLHAVYYDRVILNRGGGRLEALRLPKELAASAAPRRQGASSRSSSGQSSSGSGSLRSVISDNASRITEVIRPSPHIEGGEVVGFRVRPGRNEQAFQTLGLQSGDVVTDVNGTPLNDASAGLKLFEALGESTMANVTVLRDGQSQTLVVDMSQIQNLAENME